MVVYENSLLMILVFVIDCLTMFVTINLVIFAIILLLQIALKDIFATLKIADKGMIYLYQ